MEKLAILVFFLFMASAVPSLAKMTQMEGESKNIDVVVVEEIVTAKLGCANTGESCWNGVPCCPKNMCVDGPYNSVCVEWVDPPYFPPWGAKKANH